MGTFIILVGSRKLNRRVVLFIEELLKRGYNIIVYGLPRHKWNLILFREIKYIKVSNFSLKIGTLFKKPLYIYCFHWIMLPVALSLKLLFHARVFYDEHDFYLLNTLEKGNIVLTRIKFYILQLIEKIFLPFVDMITCVQLKENILKKHLKKYNSNVVVINNYAPYELLKIQPYKGPNRAALLYVGGLHPVKGLGLAIMVKKYLQKECELHIFGDGELFKKNFQPDDPFIFFHGYRNYDEIIQVVKNKRCIGLALYSPTSRYNLISRNSRKIFEYMALGVPIITTSVGDLGKIIKMYKCGFVLEPEFKERELISKMLELIKNYRLWSFFSQNCKKAIEKNKMWWEKEIEKFFEALSKNE